MIPFWILDSIYLNRSWVQVTFLLGGALTIGFSFLGEYTEFIPWTLTLPMVLLLGNMVLFALQKIKMLQVRFPVLWRVKARYHLIGLPFHFTISTVLISALITDKMSIIEKLTTDDSGLKIALFAITALLIMFNQYIGVYVNWEVQEEPL